MSKKSGEETNRANGPSPLTTGEQAPMAQATIPHTNGEAPDNFHRTLYSNRPEPVQTDVSRDWKLWALGKLWDNAFTAIAGFTVLMVTTAISTGFLALPASTTEMNKLSVKFENQISTVKDQIFSIQKGQERTEQTLTESLASQHRMEGYLRSMAGDGLTEASAPSSSEVKKPRKIRVKPASGLRLF